MTLNRLPHRCDDGCICPRHGTPLLYWPEGDDHACQDPQCENARGTRGERLAVVTDSPCPHCVAFQRRERDDDCPDHPEASRFWRTRREDPEINPRCTDFCTSGRDDVKGHRSTSDGDLEKMRAVIGLMIDRSPMAVATSLYRLGFPYHAIADAMGVSHEEGFKLVTAAG